MFHMKFMMNIHGIGLKDEGQPILTDQPSQPKNIQSSGFMFKDPSEYTGMTQEEKEAETMRMMGAHKRWASGTKMKQFGVSDG